MKRKGFTLIEMITVITLIGIVSAVITFYLWEAIDVWTFLGGQKRMVVSSQTAMYKMVREFKRVDYNDNISHFTSKEVTFLDIDGDTISFSQEGTSLYRNSDVLLDDLDSSNGLVLTYLDEDGTPTPTGEEISVIRINLTVVRGENRFVIESASRIRMRKLE